MYNLLSKIHRTFFVILKYEGPVGQSPVHSGPSATGEPIGTLVYTLSKANQPITVNIFKEGRADIPTPKAETDIYFVPHPAHRLGARVVPNALGIRLGLLGVGGLQIIGK